MEKDYEKIERLVKLRREYASKISATDEIIAEERKGMNKEEQEEMASEWLSRRLDVGLFNLQVLLPKRQFHFLVCLLIAL